MSYFRSKNAKPLDWNKVKDKPEYLISRDIVHMIYFGYTKEEIKDAIFHKHEGVTDSKFKQLYQGALASCDVRNEKFVREYQRVNMERCTAIVEETYEKKDYKTCLSAIDMLNKMYGVYNTKVTVTTEEPIQINFN